MIFSQAPGISGHYGGLPPLEPALNPRRGSATGSFGLPVPPDWIRRHGALTRGVSPGGGGGVTGINAVQSWSGQRHWSGGDKGGREESPLPLVQQVILQVSSIGYVNSEYNCNATELRL